MAPESAAASAAVCAWERAVMNIPTSMASVVAATKAMKPTPTNTSDMPRSSRCSRCSTRLMGGSSLEFRVGYATACGGGTWPRPTPLLLLLSGILLLPKRRLVLLLGSLQLLLGARDFLAALLVDLRLAPGGFGLAFLQLRVEPS